MTCWTNFSISNPRAALFPDSCSEDPEVHPGDRLPPPPQELEKSAAPEAPAHLKPRSGGVFHERRVRRGNDNRFLTQPITCEEMVAIRWGIPRSSPAGLPTRSLVLMLLLLFPQLAHAGTAS